MDKEIESYEKKEITANDVISGIESIPSKDWENANHPIISFAPRRLL